MGFGKIGRSTAYAARKLGLHVSVFDIDPIKNLVAHSEGFGVDKRTTLIPQADFIFGATANHSIILSQDEPILKEGAKLISCSSKRLEFELSNYRIEPYQEKIGLIKLNRKEVYLFSNGEPINFIGDFLIGAVIRVMHAEIIAAILHLPNLKKNEVTAIPYAQKEKIASLWLEHFAF